MKPFMQTLLHGGNGVFYDLSTRPTIKLTHAPLDFGNKMGTMFFLCSREEVMVRAVVEEAAALASLALFLGMVAIWAQVLSAL